MRKHPYHLVDPSPWPIVASMAALLLTVGGVMYMHGYTGGELVLLFGIGVDRLFNVCVVEGCD